MTDNEIFEEVWRYLERRVYTCEDGYEWQVICELLKAIEDREPEKYLNKRETIIEAFSRYFKNKGVLPYDNGEFESIADLDFI